MEELRDKRALVYEHDVTRLPGFSHSSCSVRLVLSLSHERMHGTDESVLLLMPPDALFSL
jgi:hypothetical protein